MFTARLQAVGNIESKSMLGACLVPRAWTHHSPLLQIQQRLATDAIRRSLAKAAARLLVPDSTCPTHPFQRCTDCRPLANDPPFPQAFTFSALLRFSSLPVSVHPANRSAACRELCSGERCYFLGPCPSPHTSGQSPRLQRYNPSQIPFCREPALSAPLCAQQTQRAHCRGLHLKLRTMVGWGGVGGGWGETSSAHAAQAVQAVHQPTSTKGKTTHGRGAFVWKPSKQTIQPVMP